MNILWWTAHPLEKGTLKCGVIVAPSWQGPAVQPGLSRP
jgi:hypothetical protein